jgi:hypothetical protein
MAIAAAIADAAKDVRCRNMVPDPALTTLFISFMG